MDGVNVAATGRRRSSAGDRRASLDDGARSGSKLEFLVVCRFEKLSVEEQSIARTASIVGPNFTSDLLNCAVPEVPICPYPGLYLSLSSPYLRRARGAYLSLSRPLSILI